MYEVTAYDRIGNAAIIRIDKYPDTCPCCHKGINPARQAAFLNNTGFHSRFLQLVCRCPLEECGLTFLAYYEGINSLHKGNETYFFRNSRPGMPKPPVIQETIKKVSPSFEKIYTEANAAESYGLFEICGSGYRKALEFLVKEYIISTGVEEKSIKDVFLSKCIEDYIDNNAVKQVAKRAAWLGNDETHFCRKWINKDLTDLKRLLHLTMNAIDNQIVAQQYAEDMREENQENF